MNYEDFLRRKQAVDLDTGIANVPSLNSGLFDFQHAVTSWALRRGRAAVFAGTGMGKSFMEMEWAKQVNEYTGKPVLILTPLAVSGQFIDEGEKFGIEIHQAKEQSDVRNGIYVTNYEKMQHFDMSAFGGVVLDESSILKSFTGKTRNMLIEECQVVPFRLAATATPAPNDFMEIGNHAEFLGVMNYTEMLAMFFVHDGGETQKWRLKGHAQSEFWQWMSTWSVMFQHPRDIGYETEGYDLPNLNIIQHTVGVDYDQNDLSTLFPMEAHTMQERITARKETISERVEKCAELISGIDDYTVIWCNLNAESEAIAKALDDTVELKGSLTDDRKEAILRDFSRGNIKRLVTKASISGFGMNWQHCHNTAFLGLNDSYEQVYQAIRRFYRFGQKSAVNAHFIAAETEGQVVKNIERKEKQFLEMQSKMIEHMKDLNEVNAHGSLRNKTKYENTINMKLPTWIGG